MRSLYSSSKLLFRNQIAIQREQKDAREEGQYQHAETRELLLKIFQSQVEMQKIVTLHQAGQPVARELMVNGQKVNLASVGLSACHYTHVSCDRF